MREEREKEGQDLLNSMAQEAETLYGIRPKLLLCEGSAGDKIVEMAMDDTSIIMLVLGVAHQHSARGKLAAWLGGQLGGKLLIPMLMVPGNLTDQQLSTLI
jgi:nucleotide-binding universal stress UspA family protein